jgi:hypothetical protein
MKKVEFALESFKNIQELIRFIDQKSGAVVVIAGLAFTAYVEFIKNLDFATLSEVSYIGIICFISSFVTVIGLFGVVWISIFQILKPRLAKNYSSEELSLFYFEHLSKLGKVDVKTEFNNLTESKMLENILDQQFEISQIMEQKTENLRRSFNFLFTSIISLMIFILTSILL